MCVGSNYSVDIICSCEDILDCGDFVLASPQSDPSKLILG